MERTPQVSRGSNGAHLVVSGLHVTLDQRGRSVSVIEDLSLDVPAGQTVALTSADPATTAAANADNLAGPSALVVRTPVTISGTVVMRPGTYQLRDGMKISDLVSDAGGLKPDAYLDRATLVRTAEDRTRSTRAFSLREALVHDPENDVILQKLDEVNVRSIWEIQERHTVSITGSVREPGTYEYLQGMTIMDLIFRAGGLKESAEKKTAEVLGLIRAGD